MAGDGPDLPRPVSDADFATHGAEEIALGQLLFYDPILSGNRNISCATCHHPRFATSDGLALGVGEGGVGLGPDRRIDPANPPEDRIPRNAPALFNLGAHEFTVLFHDGRVETDASRPSGLRTPMEDEMLLGFSGVLSAQTMFPVLSADEMAGHYSENDVSQAVRQGIVTGPGGAWDRLSRRVSAIPDYADRFARAYPDIAEGREIGFTDISNAIAAFVAHEWRSDDSPFDAHLRGEAMLAGPASRGMELFYGPARCASCHAGPFQTDHQFHPMGVPQIGPGKALSFESHSRDEGRFRVTGDPRDLYAFRTPPLRNVTRTGPWGHDGAFADLSAFLRHHADPKAGDAEYAPDVTLPAGIPGDDFAPLADATARAAVLGAVRTPPVGLSDAEIADLVAFLAALEDPVALSGRLGIPDSVPSGLPVDR
ncbi:cytochrome-c peroxidase [Mesobaculum littorinae]|uniref:Cytochrome-c peroxidase n=1 Tax=Mesobaculum littorinae TaxID=2486419 RepID=A0A438AEN0_9RHOB|nr:cytochrome c peroxidase [Mesobaculum littorinae]RVV97144.1 cytochrome-c peroxidase [Mesobaculum littorinae]